MHRSGRYTEAEVPIMGKMQRIFLAVGILAVDILIFFLPLTAIFLAYVVIVNPPWFRAFLEDFKESGD